MDESPLLAFGVGAGAGGGGLGLRKCASGTFCESVIIKGGNESLRVGLMGVKVKRCDGLRTWYRDTAYHIQQFHTRVLRLHSRKPHRIASSKHGMILDGLEWTMDIDDSVVWWGTDRTIADPLCSHAYIIGFFINQVRPRPSSENRLPTTSLSLPCLSLHSLFS